MLNFLFLTLININFTITEDYKKLIATTANIKFLITKAPIKTIIKQNIQ